jgi:hypothetical protein
VEAVMHKWFILLFGVFLGTCVQTLAQTPGAQNAHSEERAVPIAIIVQTVPTALLVVPFPPFESPVKSALHLNYVFARTYDRDSLEGLERLVRLSPVREVKTLFLRQSILPLVQVWGGRLRLDGFTSTLDTQNVKLGPSAGGGLLDYRPRRESYPGGPRSVGLCGINLTFHFGRDAQIGRPTQIWETLARIIHAAR